MKYGLTGATNSPKEIFSFRLNRFVSITYHTFVVCRYDHLEAVQNFVEFLDTKGTLELLARNCDLGRENGQTHELLQRTMRFLYK